MCPFWMPWVDRARMAARFWASPTQAISRASSPADSTARIFMATRAVGWTFVAPPTVPTAIGRVISPERSPLPSTCQSVRAV